jgi:hypothetical protein
MNIYIHFSFAAALSINYKSQLMSKKEKWLWQDTMKYLNNKISLILLIAQALRKKIYCLMKPLTNNIKADGFR